VGHLVMYMLASTGMCFPMYEPQVCSLTFYKYVLDISSLGSLR